VDETPVWLDCAWKSGRIPWWFFVEVAGGRLVDEAAVWLDCACVSTSLQ